MKKIILLSLFMIVQISLKAQNGNYTNVNGVKLYYETYGSGEPLVLLHPLWGTHETWDPYVDSLSQYYLLIIPDLRGHGKSSTPKENHRLKYIAEDVFALMDELGIEKFKAMGESMGALALIHMATMDSTRIEAMVLGSGSPYFDKQYRDLVRDWSFETSSKERIAKMQEEHEGGIEQIKWLTDVWPYVASTYDDMNFTPPLLSQIKCPTLIIHGDRDPFFNVNLALEMHKAIPNSYLWVVPNGGHMPNFQALWSDQYQKVTRLFLAGEL